MARSSFFEQQISAKKRTKKLIVLFCLGVLAIVFSVHLFINLCYSGMLEGKDFKVSVPLSLTGSITLFIIGLGSLMKIHGLRGGGEQVAMSLGGRRLNPDTQDPRENRLLNVVEEMAIASGIPVPPVYLIEEDSINAFAAGYSPKDAVIGVNRGTVDLLNRDELQGVVAHEFSHILNGDMRLNIRLIGILHGILIIAIIGRTIFNARRRRSRYSSGHIHHRRRGKSDGMLFVLGGGLLAIGWIGVLFGRLIKAAVSRQREFLADASAVQFTRLPDGIAGALKKIGGWVEGSALHHPRAEEISHMFFGNALGVSFLPLFATHPPLKERVLRIDPTFKGEFLEIKREHFVHEAPEQLSALAQTQAASPLTPPHGDTSTVDSIGSVTEDHLQYAANLLAEIPVRMRQDAQSLLGAEALVFALLLSHEEAVSTEQLTVIKKRSPFVLYDTTLTTVERLKALSQLDHFRLPLIDLTIPVLQLLNEGESDHFLETVKQLVLADKRISLFEYMLHHTLKRHILRKDRTGSAFPLQSTKLQPAAQSLLSAAVVVSTKSPEQREACYLAGAKEVVELQGTSLLDVSNGVIQAVDKALKMLQAASWRQKESILKGLERIILLDEEVTISEAELFRAIADALHCPVPPILQFAKL